ncbi:4-hydroxybenzoate octaprenyltransferase [Anaplasma phagocytophilum]|uniref:4-hydroxybenzoate octaprenyltransferase n=2 Tax=Anaplasma phagocytophilum TaxID=948 RepID=A0A0F3Q7V2_ANAPH|nr:4-hydroxybenzoate octaprenyltransferase [Anaplasma phagocytophilum]EOA63108.1 4-hydroxybenzoate polyprenyltransferase [Anaplasma phagocytophilum str. CRT38]KDB57448.1 4-hydroxybenzoate polyprenyltransferase [Anaplasma phagocytophilum str. CRT35]KJV87539.1 4-hydroxybenzoate geranyltransferase 1 [Anaplasma phagocytophilum str. CRT53-1]
MFSRVKKVFGALVPYSQLIRLHSCEISLLATFPTCASIVLASNSLYSVLKLFVFVAIGALVVRSAGCIINDIFDRNIDIHVHRTKSRPIACGRLKVREGLCALAVLLCIAGVILLFTNKLSLYLSIICFCGVVLYPLMKRFFSYPQFVLGIVWNFGILIGSAMAANEVKFGSILLYIGCIFWTTAFDTIYAHQDKVDDARLGLGSTALKFGDNTGLYVKRLYILTITMWVCAGVVSSLSWPYYVFILKSAGVFYYQWKKTDFDNPARCMYMFKTNIYAGILLFLGVCLGRIV